MIRLMADVIAANRKLLQHTQYHVRKTEYDTLYMKQKVEKEMVKTYQVVEDRKQQMKQRYEDILVEM